MEEEVGEKVRLVEMRFPDQRWHKSFREEGEQGIEEKLAFVCLVVQSKRDKKAPVFLVGKWCAVLYLKPAA